MKRTLSFLLLVAAVSAADDPVADAKAAWKARDYAKVTQLLAAAAGKPDAVFLQALMAETGRGAEMSPAAAAKLYREAMEKGSRDATAAWGRYLITGAGGVPKDQAQGLFLIRKAAEAGSPAAMTLMGDFALNGTGQEADPRTAAFWYQRASAEKEPSGFLGLAKLYDAGAAGLVKDEVRARAACCW